MFAGHRFAKPKSRGGRKERAHLIIATIKYEHQKKSQNISKDMHSRKAQELLSRALLCLMGNQTIWKWVKPRLVNWMFKLVNQIGYKREV